MKVIEVIAKCEELLEVQSTRDDLLQCFNIIENDLALNYIPLYATHDCSAHIVNYDEFEYAPVRIVMCNCKFKTYPTYIQSKDIINRVTYAYTPNSKTLSDDCSYGKGVFYCLVYGVITEYLCSKGFFEESISWDKKYKKEIGFLVL